MNTKNNAINSVEDYLIPWTSKGVPWCCRKDEKHVRIFDPVERKQQFLEVTWKQNVAFKAAMKIIMFTQTTADYNQVIVENTETEQRFYMRSSDFLKTLLKTAVIFGTLMGTWNFHRTVGKYYGLKFIGLL